MEDPDYPDVDQRTCRLLGPTALIVQALMALIVASSLIYKRHREVQKRPWGIWGFDVSKQLVGQMFVHGTNVVVSDVVADHSFGNPCALYFLNVLIDTTFGIGVIYIVHHGLTSLLSDNLQFKGFESGQYGEPPSLLYWLRQTAVYVLALTAMKVLVIFIFVIWPDIVRIGDWLLTWTRDSDALQVIFVMGAFPIIMNVLQFWLIDSIVKAQSVTSFSEDQSQQPTDSEPLFVSREENEYEPEGSTHLNDSGKIFEPTFRKIAVENDSISVGNISGGDSIGSQNA